MLLFLSTLEGTFAMLLFLSTLEGKQFYCHSQLWGEFTNLLTFFFETEAIIGETIRRAGNALVIKSGEQFGIVDA